MSESGRDHGDHEALLRLSRITADGSSQQYIVGRGNLAINTDTAPSIPVPRQLPPDVLTFTGRAAELGVLNQMLAELGRGTGLASTVISGTGGIGKTGLAVHWGHQVRHRFSDGDLYINLHGYGPGRPVEPLEALAQLLGSFGLSESELPQHLHERANRYRSLLYGKNMLVVLDNVSSIEQIRDLLPGTSTCAVVVTSRERLDGLSVQYGCRRIELDTLRPEDSLALLQGMIGDRVENERESAAALAAVCGHHTLAIRIAATNAANRPATSLDAVVADLRLAFERDDLALLSTGDDVQTDLSAVFSWSLRYLSVQSRRAFMLIGTCPVSGVDLHGLAALLDAELSDVKLITGALVRAHLLSEKSVSRYFLDDLLRSYARGLATGQLSEEDRTAAVNRYLKYHAHTASIAMNAYIPVEEELRPAPPDITSPIPDFAEIEDALKWLDAERLNLIAGALYAAGNGFPEHTCHIAVTIFRYLDIRGNLYHSEQLQTTAAKVAPPALRGRALEYRAVSYIRRGAFEQAIQCIQQSIAIAQEERDLVLEAGNLANLGYIYGKFGDHEKNLECQQAALAMILETSMVSETARIHNQLGMAYLNLGAFVEAENHLMVALHMVDEGAFAYHEAMLLNKLAMLRMQTDNPGAALEYLQRSCELFQAMGNRGDMHRTVNNIGNAYRALGSLDPAEQYHRDALTMARDFLVIDSEVVILNDLGYTLTAQGRYAQALECHRNAEELARLHGYQHELERAAQAIRTIAAILR